ncbi:MAG: hypothetical protein HQ505_01925 [Nitrosopumilus sp.]|nr:hypothetical protein [Nitrosopumilus sp.]
MTNNILYSSTEKIPSMENSKKKNENPLSVLKMSWLKGKSHVRDIKN